MFFQFALKAKCINPISDQEKNNPRDEFVSVSSRTLFKMLFNMFVPKNFLSCNTPCKPKFCLINFISEYFK